MGGEVLGHGEALEAIDAEEVGQVLVRDDPALVLGVHEVLLLEVRPHLGGEVRAGDGLVAAEELGERGGALVGLLETTGGLLGRLLLAQLLEASLGHGHVGGNLPLVALLVRLGHLLVAAAGGGVHALPLLAQCLSDVRELHAGVAGVDLGAGDLHEAHVRTLGALGLVGVDDILALAAAALLLAILANLALLGLLALGLAFSLALGGAHLLAGVGLQELLDLIADELLAVGHGNAEVALELLLDVLHGGLLQVRGLEDLVETLDDRRVLGAGALSVDWSLLGSHC
mmetsp:Transcript_12424/g.34245  ORF Transcript_12424/g.34245 Transcript_12424/m.34245 type:complete len:286 (-) Transcript_12424:46-903(-)